MSTIKKTVLDVSTHSRNEFVDITREVSNLVEECGIKDGSVILYVPHTTAAVTINENYDPSVRADIINKLSELVPPNAGYEHLEGNADSHIKSTLVGVYEVIPVENGRLQLGRWQGIFFCEFDGPRSRRLVVQVRD
ncbi:secondary thiamine-phosphate synthase enzyme YjbQ [candidate division WOR-3 bacterium]|nr:secondary thiamine-phosphate synthase enzyme YjbQ [candidate division WOR-3 bacterium]